MICISTIAHQNMTNVKCEEGKTTCMCPQYQKQKGLPCKHVFLMSFYHNINIQPQQTFPGSDAPTPSTSPAVNDCASQHDELHEASNTNMRQENVSKLSVNLTLLCQRKKATNEQYNYMYKEIDTLIKYYDDDSYLPSNSRLGINEKYFLCLLCSNLVCNE